MQSFLCISTISFDWCLQTIIVKICRKITDYLIKYWKSIAFKSTKRKHNYRTKQEYVCEMLEEIDIHGAETCAYWMEGIFLVTLSTFTWSLVLLMFQPIVGFFGLVGNIISSFILSYSEMKNSFNRLLVVLTVFDSIFITIVILDYSLVRGDYLAQLHFKLCCGWSD